MTSSAEFLRWIVDALENAEIPYMIAGSLGSTFYGEYRATNDVDIVIAPTEQQLARFIESLGEEFYISEAAARDAFQRRSMFNVIHPETGSKADLVLCKNRPFSVEEFGRRIRVNLLGSPVHIASAEDIILSKLEWSRMSGSDRQLRDALGVAKVCWKDLDSDYLRKWAAELDVSAELESLLKRADPSVAEEPERRGS